MLPDTKSSPRRATGGQDAANVTAIVTASPMRRRRATSWRLPVLASGLRDPIDALAENSPRPRRCARAVIGLDGRWRQCCHG
jgi:hypothetical protein